MTTFQKNQFHGATDVGCVRSGNEDCFMIMETGKPPSDLNPSSVFQVSGGIEMFAAVSDGMGGAAAGEVASSTALITLADFVAANAQDLEKASPRETVKIMEKGVHEANQAIFAKSQEIANRRGMGATITACYLKADVLYMFQIGDSRAYVLRENRLIRVTRDQSFVGHLVEMGTITEEQAMRHPQRNVILQALGTQEKLKVDVSYLPLCKGDLVIVCSDGLYGEFLPDQLEKLVIGHMDDELEDIVAVLLEEAKRAGGKDNITVIGLRVSDDLPEREPGEEARYRPFYDLDRDNPLDRPNLIH